MREARQDVHARRREGVVHRRSAEHLHERLGDDAAGVGLAPGALEVVDARTDLYGPSVLRADLMAGHREVVGQLRRREVDLHHRAVRVDRFDLRERRGVERAGGEEPEKGPLRVGVRQYRPGSDDLAALEPHALAGDNRRHRRVGPDRRTGFGRRIGDRFRDRSHPAAHVPPGAVHAADASE